ncbi:hypothetical protein fugu_014062 [Takifugu bimaculatus]|uniref:Fibronectin type-III domain-containing protein n=1 Tax=Takifugu bimaculatus TaxID=433685 RepID=A0A4Z2C1W3_9TELE|nr:hypothetical protein fugu_014062 [Takifugu bimaculatus]
MRNVHGEEEAGEREQTKRSENKVSPDSPDEKSPKKSCFSGPLPQLRQGKHKRTITATVAGSEHGHPFLKELTGGEKEGRVPLGIITPSPSFAHFHTYTQTSLFQFSQLRRRNLSSGIDLLGLFLSRAAALLRRRIMTNMQPSRQWRRQSYYVIVIIAATVLLHPPHPSHPPPPVACRCSTCVTAMTADPVLSCDFHCRTVWVLGPSAGRERISRRPPCHNISRQALFTCSLPWVLHGTSHDLSVAILYHEWNQTTCRPGTYKASATDAYCNKCPAHSSSPQEQAVECTCEKGFYRAEADPRAMACTRPPSAPENPISTVNETCVTLEWSPPRDTGGRGDITYSIHCRKCSGEGRKCAPCGSSVHYIPRQYGLSSTTVQVTDLQPDSNYSFTVESQNGVSDLSPTPRGTVAVNVTTSQTVSVVLKERRSKDSVTLAWQGPERPNGVIVEYEVIYYEKNQREQNYTVLKTRSNMMTVEGLKPGTTYVFRVRARTDGGYGSYGGEIELETSHEDVFAIGDPNQSTLLAVSVAGGIVLLVFLVTCFIVSGRYGPILHVFEAVGYLTGTQRSEQEAQGARAG